MVGEIATRHALSKDVIAGVSERSGGVPLFIGGVTRLLLERGEAGGVQAIPPTLQQSLAARLDRLGPAREIAQIGAVLGRGFPHALLQAVAGLDEPALRAALDRLADAELLFVEGVAPQANYRFKHALIQDAAYDSLLKSRRQTLHRRAAEMLLASPAPEAEALAHHFTLGGQTELAIEWWGKAGDQALRRSAFAEAISHLGKAIELSDKVGGARPREKEGAGDKLKLRVSYGNALLSGRGYGAPETKAAFERARETAGTTESALERFSIDYGLWSGAHLRGELPSMREMSQAFLRTSESRPELRRVRNCPPTLWHDALVRWGIHRSAHASRSGLGDSRPGPRPRSRLAFRARCCPLREGVSGLYALGDRRNPRSARALRRSARAGEPEPPRPHSDLRLRRESHIRDGGRDSRSRLAEYRDARSPGA